MLFALVRGVPRHGWTVGGRSTYGSPWDPTPARSSPPCMPMGCGQRTFVPGRQAAGRAGGEKARAYPHAVPEDHEPVPGGCLGRRREEEHRDRESEKQRWAPSPAPLRWHHFFGIDGSGRTAFGRVASWWRTGAGVEAWRDSALIGFESRAVSVEFRGGVLEFRGRSWHLVDGAFVSA